SIFACTLIALIDSQAIFADSGTNKTNDLRRTAMNSGGNADRGKVIFESTSAQCAVCHKVHGKGGEVGPDVSQIGGTFDRTHLLESILDPSAEVLQGYQTTVIETKSGRVLTGIVKSESATGLTLVDVLAARITVPVREIESRAVSKVSLMPGNLADVISP